MLKPSRPLNETIFSPFSVVADDRAGNSSYPLDGILFILVVGVVCGADDLVSVEDVARAKKKFISEFVPMKRVPTHHTLGRLLATIDPLEFRDAFIEFMSQLTNNSKKKLQKIGEKRRVGIDGKTLRGAMNKRSRKQADPADQVHLVNAFDGESKIVLAQERSDAVANEEETARRLLRCLDLRNTVVTFDAAHTREWTFKLVAAKGGDFVCTVKGNTSALFSDVQAAFENGDSHVIVVKESERNRGRLEERTYEFCPAYGRAVEKKFTPVNTFVRVTRKCTNGVGETSTSTSYAATSLGIDEDKVIARCIRGRWGIEALHYCLDVTFREDASRVRVQNAAENFSRIRQIALSLLNLDKRKASLKRKRWFADHEEKYLRKVLQLRRRPTVAKQLPDRRAPGEPSSQELATSSRGEGSKAHARRPESPLRSRRALEPSPRRSARSPTRARNRRHVPS